MNGFVLVPVEPTEEMIYCIATGVHRGDSGKEIWSEALAYAPKPPALGGEPEATAWIISDEDGTIDATVHWVVAKHSFGDVTPMISKAAHRAHLVPLQDEIERHKDRYNRDVHGLNNEGDPIGGDPAGGYINDLRSARAEIDQLKARCDELEGLIRELPYGLRELSGSENIAGVEACVEYVEQIAIAALSKPVGGEKL